MGAWGTAISSNDTYADIYGFFFDLYNEGHNVDEISEKLIAENRETIADPDDCNDFWFALAKAQWECKQLDPKLLERVKQIVTTGADIEVWRRLDASEKDVTKRSTVLENFLSTLQSERPKAKARKKRVIRQPVFEKGDCLTFKLGNGNYGGAVVLAADRESGEGYSLIAVTRINQQIKPTKKDFEKADVFLSNFGELRDKPFVSWYHPLRHKTVKDRIDIIANIPVEHEYQTKNSLFGFMGDFDIWVIQVVDRAIESEKTKPPSSKKETIKKLTRKSRRKLL